MTPCPHCSRESDRLAPLLESRLVEVNKALGLDVFALHEERMAKLRSMQAATPRRGVILDGERKPIALVEPDGAIRMLDPQFMENGQIIEAD